MRVIVRKKGENQDTPLVITTEYIKEVNHFFDSLPPFPSYFLPIHIDFCFTIILRLCCFLPCCRISLQGFSSKRGKEPNRLRRERVRVKGSR